MADGETALISTAVNHEEQNILLLSDDDYESDYDSIWKDFITEFWRDILKRFMPSLYDKADLSREPENLDKELRDLLERVMHLSNADYRLKFREAADEAFNEGGNKMRYKTVTEEIFEGNI